MAEFLFELGIEEVPVSYIKDIMGQLEKGFTECFTQQRIEYGAVETAMTNRRFLLFFNNISPVSESKSDLVKGPSRKIAYDEDQNPTKALEKFLEDADRHKNTKDKKCMKHCTAIKELDKEVSQTE